MISENIARFRKEAGLTQAQLAEKIGYERTAIARWELGTKEISALQLKAIAKILNVDVSEFYR